MKRKHEYVEGPEAGAKFRTLATALFQAPKNGRKQNKKRQPRKATSRKSPGSGKG